MSLDRKNHFLLILTHSILEFFSVQKDFKETLKKISDSNYHNPKQAEEKNQSINSLIQEYKALAKVFYDHFTIPITGTEENIKADPEKFIQIICDYLNNQYEIIFEYLIQLNKIYSEKISTNIEIQKSELNNLYIKPIQHIARYGLLLKSIEEALLKHESSQQSDLMTLLKIAQEKIKLKNTHEQIKTTQTNTPLKKKQFQDFKSIRKISDLKAIKILDQLIRFFEKKGLSNPELESTISLAYFFVYAHSFSPTKNSFDLKAWIVDLQKNLKTFLLNEGKFLADSEIKSLFSIIESQFDLDIKSDSDLIKMYHLRIESLALLNLKNLAKTINHEQYKLDYLTEIENINLSKNQILLKDLITNIIFNLNNKYGFNKSEISPESKNNLFFNQLRFIKKILKQYSFQEDLKNETPLAPAPKSKKQLTKFSILNFNVESNTPEDLFQIKSEFLFLNLLRIYNYYTDNALGKEIIQYENINQASTGRGWTPQLLSLIEDAFAIYKQSSTQNKLPKLIEAVQSCIQTITGTTSIGNAVNLISGKTISVSDLVNSLKFIHDRYSLASKRQYQQEDLSRQLPKGVIKSSPHEHVEDYFQKTVLLYLKERMSLKKSTLSEQIKTQLQSWSLIRLGNNNTEARLQAMQSATDLSQNHSSDSAINPDFLSCLMLYFHQQQTPKAVDGNAQQGGQALHSLGQSLFAPFMANAFKDDYQDILVFLKKIDSTPIEKYYLNH